MSTDIAKTKFNSHKARRGAIEKKDEKAQRCRKSILRLWPVSERQKRKGVVMPFCVGTQKGGQTNRASWWFAGTVKGEEFWKEKNVISSRDY